jgi:lysophospholipase L1-like esterase
VAMIKLAGALTGILAGTLTLAACSGTRTVASTSSTRPADAYSVTQGSYVALGDSYTSGPDIPDQVSDPAGCARSDRDYPALVAQSLKVAAKTHDMSCSGARITNLTTSQSTDDGTNPAQLSALSTNTTLVTLGIGGNDVDFAGVLTKCVELDLVPSFLGGVLSTDSAPCHAYYTSGGVDQIQQTIQTAEGSLTDALAQIKARAPHAHVYVVGYPDLLPSSGTSCAHTLGITADDVVFLNGEELKLNSMLQQQAANVGATYVDTYTPSEGHDACSGAATRWIEPLAPASPAAPLHPNATGEQGMADAVLSAIKSTT